MNVSMRQIEMRLVDIDWSAAGAEGLALLTKPMLEGTKAEAEFDARSRTVSAWLQASFIVSFFALAAAGKPWGMTSACILLTAMMVNAATRSHQARRALQRAREATYEAVDDLSHQFPKPLPEAPEGRAAAP